MAFWRPRLPKSETNILKPEVNTNHMFLRFRGCAFKVNARIGLFSFSDTSGKWFSLSDLEIEKIFFLFFLHLGSIAFHYYGPLHYCVLPCSASLPGKLKAALSSEMRALHLANSQSESKSRSRCKNYSLFPIDYISCSTPIFTHTWSTHISFCYWMKQTIVIEEQGQTQHVECLSDILLLLLMKYLITVIFLAYFYSEILSNCFYTYINT